MHHFDVTGHILSSNTVHIHHHIPIMSRHLYRSLPMPPESPSCNPQTLRRSRWYSAPRRSTVDSWSPWSDGRRGSRWWHLINKSREEKQQQIVNEWSHNKRYLKCLFLKDIRFLHCSIYLNILPLLRCYFHILRYISWKRGRGFWDTLWIYVCDDLKRWVLHVYFKVWDLTTFKNWTFTS